MDDIVRQAMVKWPNVPNCFGWLGLDARGHWYLRDLDAQACGPFGSGLAGARGARLAHQTLLAFIARNYEADAQGRWFFQNGPQRVFVELEAAPWILRVDDRGGVQTHAGIPAQVQDVLLDEQGRVFLGTSVGLGLVHSQDMIQVARCVERGDWAPQPVQASALPARYGFVLSPQMQESGVRSQPG